MADGRAQTGRVPLSAPVSFLAGTEAAAAVCPFLGALDDVGVLGDAVATYDERNRCTAYGPWQPLGQLQQELVCLTVAHTSCPRYARGVRYGPRGGRRRPGVRSGALVFILAGLAVLALGAAVVFAAGYVGVPFAGFFGAAQTATPTAPPTATPTATLPPTAPPTQAPSASPSPTAEPTPTATETSLLPTPPPGSAYATLEPCPNGELCYLYTVKSGDTLFAISQRFGVTLADLRALNPAIQNTNIIHVGQTLKIPPP